MAEILPVQADETEKRDAVKKSPSGRPLQEGQYIKNGIVYNADGKPCKQCNSFRDLMALGRMTGKALSTSGASQATTVTSTSDVLPADCPPDVERLGNATWTLLHSLAATYPEHASSTQQAEMSTFLRIFGKIYPCWFCAADFRKWMDRNEPKLEGRKDFGLWMCNAHNAVNVKLGKKEFDCRFWEERWREASDGHCG